MAPAALHGDEALQVRSLLPDTLAFDFACHSMEYAPGAALRRRGATVGDEVWVTGTVGDGALGLLALRGQVPDPDGWLAGRYRLPQPRLGLALHGIVSACMDVSDGLVQDLGHLCRAAGLGAVIEAALVPRSRSARAAGDAWLNTCLTGGDDYELLMAVPSQHADALVAAATAQGCGATRIGRFEAGDQVRVLDGAGTPISLDRPGWSHF